jgi:hypothetical protein
MGVFERLVGPCSLDCFEAPIVCQHVALPISSGSITLISSKVIDPTTYLRSWALVTPIIASKFLLDFCLFLLKVIGVSNLRPLLFQVHLRLTQELLPPKSIACVPPFE